MSRVEVRLGPGWNADSAHVLVRNRAGLFEQVGTHAAVVVDAGHIAPSRSPVHFRIESTRPVSLPVAIPVEYRVTIGSGDEIAVWTFPSIVRPTQER
ncbi:MAG TPA: hypothetical protein VFM38_04425 [Candidatus Limnocylindrales bacterium]|nr:hypothetical protein [Candidatus Limnocylindrales bacterium]